uniref:Uncharacterized protein n=1 Tax=Manihot esculenta TaxID=3983 RepID=A0A2C9W8H6_MANES
MPKSIPKIQQFQQLKLVDFLSNKKLKKNGRFLNHYTCTLASAGYKSYNRGLVNLESSLKIVALGQAK